MVHIRSTSESAVAQTSLGSPLRNADERSRTRSTRALRDAWNWSTSTYSRR